MYKTRDTLQINSHYFMCSLQMLFMYKLIYLMIRWHRLQNIQWTQAYLIFIYLFIFNC